MTKWPYLWCWNWIVAQRKRSCNEKHKSHSMLVRRTQHRPGMTLTAKTRWLLLSILQTEDLRPDKQLVHSSLNRTQIQAALNPLSLFLTSHMSAQISFVSIQPTQSSKTAQDTHFFLGIRVCQHSLLNLSQLDRDNQCITHIQVKKKKKKTRI